MDSRNELNKKKSQAIDLVADAAGQFFEYGGYRALVGKIWVVLLLSEEPLDATGLKETLGCSTGTMSMTLKELVTMGIVYRETVLGDRRFYYRAETDLWIVASRVFRERERKRLRAILNKMKEAEELLVSDSSEEKIDNEDSFLLEQVTHLVSVGEFIVNLLDAVMERTKVEFKAAQKILSVSGIIGGEPLSRIRRAINASRFVQKRRS